MNEIDEIINRSDYLRYKREVIKDVLNFCIEKNLYPVGEELKPDGDIVITLRALPIERLKRDRSSYSGEESL